MPIADTVQALFERLYGARPEITASAPGRIEFIGNHTDYNGGLVLGAAIDRRIGVALRKRTDGTIRLASDAEPQPVEVQLADVKRQEGKASWANYPLGVLVMLQEAGLKPDVGCDLAVASDLPVGAGLSSSAALELATAVALAQAFGGSFERADLARIGRRAENQFVGVPCGILDQGVSAFGAKDHLVRIDCLTEAFSTVPMPEGTAFWIFNSHQKHALIGSLYATRHQECMEARDVLAAQYPGTDYLAGFMPEQVQAQREALGEVRYRRALHVTTETRRVTAMQDALAAGDLATAGGLLVASHESSRDCFENSTPELDFLVAQLTAQPGVYGARLTGGGFGGAVMAFTSPEFTTTQADAVADAYAARFGDRPDVLPMHTDAGARLEQS